MVKYCAFIKQVRVHNKNISNREFCDLFEKCGMKNVSSVISSGNIIFESDKSKNIIQSKLDKSLREYFDYNINIFLKNYEEIQQMVEKMPFVETSNHYICFLLCEGNFEQVLLEKFNITENLDDELGVAENGVFYWKIAKNVSISSKFYKIINSKKLAYNYTNRTVGTMKKVYRKMVSIDLCLA
jgi:uncharacterized protein (DUF1697 family)